MYSNIFLLPPFVTRLPNSPDSSLFLLHPPAPLLHPGTTPCGSADGALWVFGAARCPLLASTAMPCHSAFGSYTGSYRASTWMGEHLGILRMVGFWLLTPSLFPPFVTGLPNCPLTFCSPFSACLHSLCSPGLCYACPLLWHCGLFGPSGICCWRLC